MDVLPPMTKFYEAIAEDARISSTHISLFMALLHYWNLAGCKNPLMFRRQQVMRTAKIFARHTYNKSINELCEYGYIKYEPSKNGYTLSSVYLDVVNSENKH